MSFHIIKSCFLINESTFAQVTDSLMEISICIWLSYLKLIKIWKAVIYLYLSPGQGLIIFVELIIKVWVSNFNIVFQYFINKLSQNTVNAAQARNPLVCHSKLKKHISYMFLQQFIISFFKEILHNFICARLIISIVVLYFIPVLHHVLKSQTTPPR